MKDLWFGTSGPKDAPIVLVGESWGFEEKQQQIPFVGTSGTELNRMLAEAGISRSDILLTNVVAEQPQQNEMWRFFHAKDTPGGRPLVGGLDPRDNIREDVKRLYDQLSFTPRKLTIVCGNYALWSLTQNCTKPAAKRSSNNRPIPRDQQTLEPTGIMSWRGSMWYTEPHPEFGTVPKMPLLPIIHPAAIQRDWSGRAPTVHDLKVRVPMALRDEWRPKTEPIYLAPPSFERCIHVLDVWANFKKESGNDLRLSVDIETARGLITCLGIADRPDFAMCIPFIRRTPNGGFDSFWPPDQEAQIVARLRKLFRHPDILIEGQNFIYDTQYIQHWMGSTPRLNFDTMLAQNVVFPGTPKDLSYLSSMYCQFHWYWKEDHKEWDLSGTLEDLLIYNCVDCCRTWEIAESQRQYLVFLKQEEQMDFKMRTNALCLRMMNRGVAIDKTKRAGMLFELQTALQGLYEELLKIIPQKWIDPDAKVMWYRSPKQTQYLFYDLLGMKVVKNRKTGQPTTGKEALMQLEKWYPEFTGLFKRLDMAGSVDNTVGVIQSPLDPDGKMRCAYNPGGTETHRLSSSTNAFGRGTNLQNLSKGEEDD